MLEAIRTNLPLESLSNISSILGPIGLLALADLSTVPLRTTLTGTSSWLDIFILAPGLHRQATAPDLTKGEYPACAAMTTGYVFRVENPATVHYLQRVGKTGHVTTLFVTSSQETGARVSGSGLAYVSALLLSVSIPGIVVLVGDIVTTAVIGLLILSRLINVSIIRRRAQLGWFGALEPGVQSDLLVLLSQDRWFRIQGATDDVKAITSGAWLRDATFLQSSLVSFATLLVYISAAMSLNATPAGKLALLLLFTGNAALLGLTNESTKTLTMFNRTISIKHAPRPYDRRLDLTKELVQEFKRTDCFVAMGMIQPEKEKELQKSYKGAVMM
ncbi:hypothetical protein M409DRAFT_70975 [Zasmidium cellare ATCC 36951]|uniref:Uncharacterized protein n=1 Tax=Zasmidium cellare ATCC 36951 TaxID=1080233 RepID=A0A6A6C1E6_ZASCE|nr:uncharacterized protein M409DRAFT_70975 [Zasmidium cellare ATCC 36951]KAF2159536.1 hypothetical protein M409DRAFT_70975 [Zasmidium cellare ATCC 36951]